MTIQIKSTIDLSAYFQQYLKYIKKNLYAQINTYFEKKPQKSLWFHKRL